MEDVIVIGGGAAGSLAAIRAAHLGARTVLVTRGTFEGTCAADGPIPARTLAHAARSLRSLRELEKYGIVIGAPALRYEQLLSRVRDVLEEARRSSDLRKRMETLGVTLHEHCGRVRFIDANSIGSESGLRLSARKFIVCTGSSSRTFAVPGIDLTRCHRDVWNRTDVPRSMIVLGGGSSGVQTASVFHAFGTRVRLFESGRQILASEDESVAAAVTEVLRGSGIEVIVKFGSISRFESVPGGVRMRYRSDSGESSAEADVVVMAAGRVPDTARLGLAEIGVALEPHGSIRVDEYLRTTAPHVFAAGDVAGRPTLRGAVEEGFIAATNAVRGPVQRSRARVGSTGSYSHPEYAQVGLTEAQARRGHDVVVDITPFRSAVRAIVEGVTSGFCKLVGDRATGKVLGCHVVGERAVEIAQLAAVAIAAGMRVDELARVAVSFPTYAEVLIQAAARMAVELDLSSGGDAAQGRGSARPL